MGTREWVKLKEQTARVPSFSKRLCWLHPPKDSRHTLEKGDARARLGKEPGRNLPVLILDAKPLSLGWRAGRMGSWLFALSGSTICPHSGKPRGGEKFHEASHLREAVFPQHPGPIPVSPLSFHIPRWSSDKTYLSGGFCLLQTQLYIWMSKWQASNYSHFAG